MSKKIKPPKHPKDIPLVIISQMLTLTTSGFGLVAALAWNEVIQELVSTHIKPYFPEGYGLISMIIYAVAITVFAVLITLQLSLIQSRLKGLRTK